MKYADEILKEIEARGTVDNTNYIVDDGWENYIRKRKCMNKKPLDKTKKSNIKCEHCKYWCEWSLEGKHKDYYCKNICSPQYNNQRNYWNRCKQFEWVETEETDGTNKQA